ncbi:MAG: elongation factor P [Firmicutes bacterium]|nr:elongation factor P [Bacillota bacterium]
MISTNDLRTGVVIVLEGELYSVVEFQHVKRGRGGAFVRARLKNIKTGQVHERTMNAGENVPKAHLDRREVQFLYRSGDENVFMDMETYEQIPLHTDQLADATKYLKENMNLHFVFFQDKIVGVEPPFTVELEITKTDPGIRGDTATGGSKPATLETGLVIQVPLFVNEGDVVRVDTRTGHYLERA